MKLPKGVSVTVGAKTYRDSIPDELAKNVKIPDPTKGDVKGGGKGK